MDNELWDGVEAKGLKVADKGGHGQFLLVFERFGGTLAFHSSKVFRHRLIWSRFTYSKATVSVAPLRLMW